MPGQTSAARDQFAQTATTTPTPEEVDADFPQLRAAEARMRETPPLSVTESLAIYKGVSRRGCTPRDDEAVMIYGYAARWPIGAVSVNDARALADGELSARFRGDEKAEREFIGILQNRGRETGAWVAIFRDVESQKVEVEWPHQVRRMMEYYAAIGVKASESLKAWAALGERILEAPPPTTDPRPIR